MLGCLLGELEQSQEEEEEEEEKGDNKREGFAIKSECSFPAPALASGTQHVL